jgi:hypothetical protein
LHELTHLITVLLLGGDIYEIGFNYIRHNISLPIVNLIPIIIFPITWLLLFIGSKREKKPSYESTIIYGLWLGEMVNFVAAFNSQNDYNLLWEYSVFIYLILLCINIGITIYLLYKNI